MLPPLEIRGRSAVGGAKIVRFASACLLAPMEGITDPVFRSLVIGHGGVGGASTEFIRITVSPTPVRSCRKHLGEHAQRAGVAAVVPTAVQLMAAGPEFVTASAANAERVGASWIDLNFGCPAPVVFRKCAGSALLDHPKTIAAITAAAVAGTSLPVSVKMRVGVTSDARLEENLGAAVEAGAAMVILHARLRTTAYHQPARWEWLARAAAWLQPRGVPLIGNGGVDTAADATRMLAQTGCAGAMIGRAALADPWIFRAIAGGSPATQAEARAFPRRYAAAIATGLAVPPDGTPVRYAAALAKLKQLVRYYRAGDFFVGREELRRDLLRCADAETILRAIEAG